MHDIFFRQTRHLNRSFEGAEDTIVTPTRGLCPSRGPVWPRTTWGNFLFPVVLLTQACLSIRFDKPVDWNDSR